MANRWIRWGLLVGSALSMTGCLEMALIEIMKDEDEDDDLYSCGDYECGDTYDESGVYWDEYEDYDEPEEEMYEEEFYEEVPDETYYAEDSVDVTNSALAGDMGSVRGFDDEEPMNRGYSYESWTTVEIHAKGQNGTEAAMAIFQIDGGIDHPGLRPGEHFEFSLSNFEYDTRFDQPLRMDVVGCSGPSEGDWLYDAMADDVVVDVSEGSTPGSIVIDFTTTFTDYGTGEQQTVVGSFETTGATQDL